MDVDTFENTNRLADFVFKEIQTLQNEHRLSRIKAKLDEIAADLPHGYSITVNFSVEVFDENREKAIKLLDTGISCTDHSQPYFSSGESPPAKYIVDGFMMKVPHDYCPNCWAPWGFKLKNRQCKECGYRLGGEIKLLIDTDQCPECEEGRVSFTAPHCDRCSFSADPHLVVWG